MRYLIIIILFSSCRVFEPKQFCADRYPPEIVSHDSTWTEYCWDTLTIFQPYADLLFDTTTNIPNYVEIHHSNKKGSLNARIDISKGKLTFRCSEDSLKDYIAYQKKIITKVQSTVKVLPGEVKYIEPWYTVPLVWCFILFLIENIVIITYKYIKKK